MAKPRIERKIVDVRLDRRRMTAEERTNADYLEKLIKDRFSIYDTYRAFSWMFPDHVVVTREVHTITKEITHE